MEASSNWLDQSNTNGVAMEIPSRFSCGSMFRNANGDHISSFYFFIGEGNALATEFVGVIMAMDVAIDKNWDNILIGTNSLIVVKSLYNTNIIP